MKKTFLLLIALVLLLSACAGPAPIEKARQKAVSIGEQFLNYELTAAEAKEQLDSIMVPETEGNGQLFLKKDIAYLSFIIGKRGSTYEEIADKVEFIRTRTYE